MIKTNKAEPTDRNDGGHHEGIYGGSGTAFQSPPGNRSPFPNQDYGTNA